MKSADIFWQVIQQYNNGTILLQILISLFILGSIFIAYLTTLTWIPKLLLAITDLFIAIVFFLIYDKSSIGYYFAFPLFTLLGILLVIDSIAKRNDSIKKIKGISVILLVLTLLYPVISLLLGHVFPKQVLYILPCPVICINIVVYSRYSNLSTIILILMTIWALTGIKAFLFNAYEDLILFIHSFYSIYLLIQAIKKSKLTT